MRFVHQLSLLLIATVLAAVAAVAGLVLWNLRAGFSDYLQAQDGEHLSRLVDAAERDLAQRDGLPQDWRPVLRTWLEASRGWGTRGPTQEARSAGRPDELPDEPPRAEDRPVPHATRRDPPPARRDPSNIGARIVVLSADGTTPLAGRRETLERPGQARPVQLNGETVVVLRLAERAGPAEGVDASFLSRQYLGLAAVAGGVLVVALVLARGVAVRWARPLAEAQVAARRIAAGEFDVRLPEPRAGGASEITALHGDINAMAGALSLLESSRRRWIAELSHELRTPLAVLRGEVEALVDGIRPLDRAALASLQEEVKRLSRLVEDFHLLATSELRALPCEFEPVAPAALLQASVDRVAPRARAQGLAIETQLPPALPAAQWDAVRISQLLANLLENSLRYTEAPGAVQVTARALGASIEIRLDDTPPGVPEADLERLFDPLYRADPSRSRAFGGSGLGLAIAKAIAQAHGGWLRAEVSPLGGLAVVLTLPLKPGGGEG